jgi:hypothetical protein
MKRFDVADRPITGYETIGVTRLTPTIGATLDGIDLSRPISEQQLTEVKRALADHLVIFFRDQKISIEQHKAFGRLFGELHVHPVYGMKDHPEVLEIKADENSKGVAGEAWHTDVSCDAQPPAASILYMHEVPANGGGDTLFSNMYAAWETLSEPMRKMLDGLRAVKLLQEGGRITAATSSQICDGASGVMVVSERALKEHNLTPLARVHHLSLLGHDPVIMLEAPIPATERALKRAGMSIDDIDLFEVNEAFASVPVAFIQKLGADPERVNVNGGAIALGHPLGASGTKLMTTLLYALKARGKKYGLQTMCEGGGLANVTIVERL